MNARSIAVRFVGSSAIASASRGPRHVASLRWPSRCHSAHASASRSPPRAVLGVGVEPLAQRSPAAHQHLVRQLVRRPGLAVVHDQQPALDQRRHRPLRPPR